MRCAAFRPGSGSGMTAKPESSNFNYFWMPDQVRHDGFGTFYEAIKLKTVVKSCFF